MIKDFNASHLLLVCALLVVNVGMPIHAFINNGEDCIHIHYC